MLNIATPNGNRILNIENFRARILNIEFLRSRTLNIDPSVMISIFGVVTSILNKRCAVWRDVGAAGNKPPQAMPPREYGQCSRCR